MSDTDQQQPPADGPISSATGLPDGILPPENGVVRRRAIVVLVVGLLAYLSSFSGVFLFDDDHAIVQNPYIRSLWPISRAMSAPQQATVAGRPLVSLSLAFNYALGGLNPWGYHAFNLIVHLLCGLLLFGIVRRTLSSGRIQDRTGQAAPVLAMIIALLWVVHPLQTESVTYVIQRTESMMGLFYLLTLYCFIRSGAAPQSLAWKVAAVLSCALGMACKEVMVTAPLMVLLYDRIFVADSFRQIAARRYGLYLGLAATWIILAISSAAGPRSASVGFAHGISAFDYAKNQCLAILTYLKLAFWPHPLLLDYGTPQSLPVGQVAPYAAALAVLLAATVISLIYRPWLGFLGAWFFIILAPTSSFVPIITEVAAERRVYLPLAAVIALVVVGAYGLVNFLGRGHLRPRHVRQTATAFAFAAICVLGILTDRRNRLYQDDAKMWHSVLAVNPRSLAARTNQVHSLVRAGKAAEAERLCVEALEIKPDDLEILINMGIALFQQGRKEQGIEAIRKALVIRPDSPSAHYNLGFALQQTYQFKAAVIEFRAVQRVEPYNLAAYVLAGDALLEQGYLDEALAELRKAVLMALPDTSKAVLAAIHLKMALILTRQGKSSEAIAESRAAVAVDPQNHQAHFTLGLGLEKEGKMDEAIRAYQAALALKPGYADAEQALLISLQRQKSQRTINNEDGTADRQP
jgi:protein O-mannosyl-transferase